MPMEVKIPNVGESIAEVQLVEWLKPDGAEVKRDENLAVIDSDKATLDLPAPESGRLKILQPAGGAVKVGEVIGQIEPAGHADEAKGEKAPAKAESLKPETPEAAPPKPAPTEKETKVVEKKKAMPAKPTTTETIAPREKAEPEPAAPPTESRPAIGATGGREEET